MLQFAENWSWMLKAFMALSLMVPLSLFMMFFQKKFGISGETFFFGWFLGVILAFALFAHTSPTMSSSDLFQPLIPFLTVVVLGIVFGGMGNVFLSQSVLQAPNPGLTWAILSIGTPLVYVATVVFGKVFSSSFPPIEFSMVNLIGIVIMSIGLVMVMYQQG